MKNNFINLNSLITFIFIQDMLTDFHFFFHKWIIFYIPIFLAFRITPKFYHQVQDPSSKQSGSVLKIILLSLSLFPFFAVTHNS